MTDISYYVFLDDQETYCSLDGSLIVGISSKNRRANRALDEDDLETVLECADVIEPLQIPRRPS